MCTVWVVNSEILPRTNMFVAIVIFRPFKLYRSRIGSVVAVLKGFRGGCDVELSLGEADIFKKLGLSVSGW